MCQKTLSPPSSETLTVPASSLFHLRVVASLGLAYLSDMATHLGNSRVPYSERKQIANLLEKALPGTMTILANVTDTAKHCGVCTGCYLDSVLDIANDVSAQMRALQKETGWEPFPGAIPYTEASAEARAAADLNRTVLDPSDDEEEPTEDPEQPTDEEP